MSRLARQTPSVTAQPPSSHLSSSSSSSRSMLTSPSSSSSRSMLTSDADDTEMKPSFDLNINNNNNIALVPPHVVPIFTNNASIIAASSQATRAAAQNALFHRHVDLSTNTSWGAEPEAKNNREQQSNWVHSFATRQGRSIGAHNGTGNDHRFDGNQFNVNQNTMSLVDSHNCSGNSSSNSDGNSSDRSFSSGSSSSSNGDNNGGDNHAFQSISESNTNNTSTNLQSDGNHPRVRKAPHHQRFAQTRTKKLKRGGGK